MFVSLRLQKLKSVQHEKLNLVPPVGFKPTFSSLGPKGSFVELERQNLWIEITVARFPKPIHNFCTDKFFSTDLLRPRFQKPLVGVGTI